MKTELPPQWNKGFPTQDVCNPADPWEFALWALVALPGQNGGPLILPVSYLQMVSKRLWDAGFRYVEELQTIKYRKPTGTESNWMTTPGKWVPANTPEPKVDPMEVALATLTTQQKAELLQRLESERNGDTA